MAPDHSSTTKRKVLFAGAYDAWQRMTVARKVVVQRRICLQNLFGREHLRVELLYTAHFDAALEVTRSAFCTHHIAQNKQQLDERNRSAAKSTRERLVLACLKRKRFAFATWAAAVGAVQLLPGSHQMRTSTTNQCLVVNH